MKVKMQDLEWCANWQQDDRFYCTVSHKGTKKSKGRGFHEILENLFGNRYGGFRYNHHRNGYEIWFRNKDDMLTFKLMAGN
jgi:hypothetical protein